MLSPNCTGMIDTRKSTISPCRCQRMRPSCGSRRSAMFSREMILMRLTTAGNSDLGNSRIFYQRAVDAIQQFEFVVLGRDADVRVFAQSHC